MTDDDLVIGRHRTPGFGMLTDRFGVTWLIDVRAPQG